MARRARGGGLLALAADLTGVHHWRKDSAIHQVILCMSLFAMYATLLLTAFVVNTDEVGPTGHKPFDLWTAMSIVTLFSIEMLKDATTDMTKLLKQAATAAMNKERGSSLLFFPAVEESEIYETMFRMHFSELLQVTVMPRLFTVRACTFQKLLVILTLYSTADSVRYDPDLVRLAAILVPVFFVACLFSSYARIRCMADDAGPNDVNMLFCSLLIRPAVDISQMALVVASLHPMLGSRPEFDAILWFDIAAFGMLAITAVVYARVLPRALVASQNEAGPTDATPLLSPQPPLQHTGPASSKS